MKDKSNNFWHAYSHILYEPLCKKVGTGGQISFKTSQEPKTIMKTPYPEVGHETQEYDLTNSQNNL